MSNDLSGLGSYEIWTEQPNWIRVVPLKMLERSKILSFPGTAKKILSDSEVSPVGMTLQYLASTKAKEKEILDWFSDRKGRLGAFWCPSFTTDFELIDDAIIGATVLKVAHNRFFDTDSNNERIYIYQKTGDWVTRKITEAADVDDHVELTIDTALAQAIELENYLVGRLYLVRFAKDKLIMKYITDTVSECDWELQEVPNEMD